MAGTSIAKAGTIFRYGGRNWVVSHTTGVGLRRGVVKRVTARPVRGGGIEVFEQLKDRTYRPFFRA